ncbi:MAG TPA: hypothetical protein VFO65_07170 [Acidimicrobiales bacterium]|nr:hypothetical protein [Acidimicrobiales bacterium]
MNTHPYVLEHAVADRRRELIAVAHDVGLSRAVRPAPVRRRRLPRWGPSPARGRLVAMPHGPAGSC